MMDEEAAEAALVAVFDHYDLPEPRHGEHPMKCPVHGDRVASASVNRGKGLWHCHACGAGEDAVSLVMALENLEYKDARSRVEALTGGSMARTRPSRGKSKGGRWIPPKLRSAV